MGQQQKQRRQQVSSSGDYGGGRVSIAAGRWHLPAVAVPANCIGNEASGALKRAPGAEPTRAVKRESEECGLLLTKA